MNRITTSFLITISLLVLSHPLAAGDPIRRDVSARVSAGAITRLMVDVPYSHLTITTGDARTIEAFGYVTRSWRTSKQRDAAHLILADSNVRIDVEGSTAYVRRQLGENAQSRKARGSDSMFVLAVRVPPGTNIVTRQKKGTVTAKGTFATIDLGLTSGDVSVEVPKRSVGELIARTRYGLLEVHLGDRVIENEGFMPRKAHYFYEGGQNVLTAIVRRGNISLKLVD